MEAGRTLSPNANQDPPRKIYSLSQLGESLKRTLEQVTHGRELWFKAEIAKLTTSPSGHMYLELVEEAEGVRLASMRGTLWKSQRAKVLESLGESAQHVLSPGTEIVFTANIQYHPIYGISLVIEDIDVSAMIGEAEKRKRETLANLKAQGALEWNKEIALPRLVQRVALIGSPGTSGFRDFGTHLMLNEWGVGFDVEVFPATVQGKDAPGAICLALEKAAAWNPDAVVLVRGAALPSIWTPSTTSICAWPLRNAPMRSSRASAMKPTSAWRTLWRTARSKPHSRGGLFGGPPCERRRQTRRVACRPGATRFGTPGP